MVILKGSSLVFAYAPPSDVLRGIDFEVDEGEVICVIGPNGAGKSTLLRVLSGLLNPREGRVDFGGRPVSSLRARERAKLLALVPQALFSLPDLSVRDFVSQGRYAYRSRFRPARPEDAAAIDRALADAELIEYEAQPLDALSGGQRQRALVARALAQEPRIVLVDEPTNSLDPRHQLQVFDVIARLGCEGRAAVVVTHDLNLASQYATRVVLVSDGRVAATGSVREMLRPEVLVPVYGKALAFGERFVPGWNEDRPFVLPWRV